MQASRRVICVVGLLVNHPDVWKEWNMAIDFQSMELEHVEPKIMWIDPGIVVLFFLFFLSMVEKLIGRLVGR